MLILVILPAEAVLPALAETERCGIFAVIPVKISMNLLNNKTNLIEIFRFGFFLVKVS